MISLTSPSWLFALGALAIPIALHLWSRRPSQVVRIGTLAHLEGAPGARAWGRQLDDLPLLALRIVILLSCIAGLVGPTWTTTPNPAGSGGTLVVADPALVADSLEFYSDPLVDSLRRTRTPIHLLSEGFPVLGAGLGGSTPGGLADRSLWSWLAAFDRDLPPNQTLLVLARPRAGHLGAGRPEVGSSIRWYAPHSPPGPELLVEAWPGAGDTTITLLEQSDSFSIARRLEPREGGSVSSPRIAEAIALPGPDLNVRSVRYSAVQTVVDEGDRREYGAVSAALNATLTSTQGFMPPSTRRVGASEAGGDRSTELIVWLNSQSVSDSFVSRVTSGAWLIQFVAIEPGTNTAPPEPAAWIQAGNEEGRWIGPLPSETPGARLWRDFEGRPLVTATAHGAGRWYRIGVTGPDWPTRAAGDPVLPQLFHSLLAHGTPSHAAPVAASQASPIVREGRSSVPAPPTDLAPPLFLLAVLLLGGERLLVHRRQRAEG